MKVWRLDYHNNYDLLIFVEKNIVIHFLQTTTTNSDDLIYIL